MANNKEIDNFTTTEGEIMKLFDSGSSGSGDSELLRVATQYAIQLTGDQMRLLLLLANLSIEAEMIAEDWKRRYKEEFIEMREYAKVLKNFIEQYITYKSKNGSDLFVMKLMEYVSLKNFMGSGLMANVQKQA